MRRSTVTPTGMPREPCVVQPVGATFSGMARSSRKALMMCRRALSPKSIRHETPPTRLAGVVERPRPGDGFRVTPDGPRGGASCAGHGLYELPDES